MGLAVKMMPDDPTRLARWLDAQLVGDRLIDLVEELTVVHAATKSVVTLRDLLGERIDSVVDSGLANLSVDALRSLLRNPQLFLELQEIVYLDGGEYWKQIARPQSLMNRGVESWGTISSRLPNSLPIVSLNVAKSSGRKWYKYFAVSIATAAVVLLSIVFVEQFRPKNEPNFATINWGWAKPNGLPKNLDAKGYLNSLADTAQEWSNQKPDTPSTLAKRILEFREGCSVLLLADHGALPEVQRTQLKDRCRKWAAKLDASLARLEAGEDVTKCRSEVDSTVQSLIEYLRNEALNS